MTRPKPIFMLFLTGVRPAVSVIGPKAESTERECVVRLGDTTVYAGAVNIAAILPRL